LLTPLVGASVALRAEIEKILAKTEVNYFSFEVLEDSIDTEENNRYVFVAVYTGTEDLFVKVTYKGVVIVDEGVLPGMTVFDFPKELAGSKKNFRASLYRKE